MDWLSHDVIIGTSTSVAGAVLMLITQSIFWKLRESSGGYTGAWRQNIFDEQGNIVKRDQIDLRQRGELLYGTINRFFRTNKHTGGGSVMDEYAEVIFLQYFGP